jgi:hypothetical protein
MGKAGRVACIFTPYVLTIASLICIIMVGLGCTKSSSDTLNNLYFMRVSPRNNLSPVPRENAINHMTSID